MGLICRPILIYNEYVPAIVGRRTWQYQVFGYHDGMDVRKSISIEKTESFQQLYDIYVQENQTLEYSVQIHYGLHEDDGAEEAFWETDTLFTFVSFIQFKKKEVNEYNNCLEREISGKKNNLMIRAYYALDYNDSILIIKSDRYDKGMQFINKLHENVGIGSHFEISSSYSILAFKKNRMDQDEGGKEEEIIGKVELRVMEQYPGSGEVLYNKLEEEFCAKKGILLNRYALLGMDDKVIEIENIPCNVLLELYAEDTGILCNSNAESQKYAAAITTKLMYKKEKREGLDEKSVESGSRVFCDALNHYIRHFYENRNSLSELAEKKTLIKITNELGKIEYIRNSNGTIIEYNFFTLFLPFYFFVRLHMRAADQSKEYYDFLTYFNICTQNYDKPDRVFVQNADFNIRYFEMQTKYFTLYSAYIYRLKQLLNKKGKNKYEFVLCPGMSAMTEVAEFHEMEDDEYRLFKVEIAETTMYNIKDMLCILGHEVAHFVGTDIRSRVNRYEHMIKMASRAVVLEFQSCFEAYEFGDKVDDEIWRKFEIKFYKWMQQYIGRMYTVDYLKDRIYLEGDSEIIQEFINENYNKYRLYTRNMKGDLERAVKDMLKLQGKDIFEDVVWGIFIEKIDNHTIEYSDKDQFIEKCQRFLHEVSDSFLNDNNDITHIFTLSEALDIELYLLKECYADLISVLVLNLSLREYLDVIVKLTKNDGHSIKELRATKIIARVAIVMAVLHHKDSKSEKYHRWTNDELMNDIEDDALMDIQKAALDFMWVYINNSVSSEPHEVVQDKESIIYDQMILREIISYLLYCREKFYDTVDAESFLAIGQFKRLTEYTDIGSFYKLLMQLIVEYETDIYSDLARTANEMTEKVQKNI